MSEAGEEERDREREEGPKQGRRGWQDRTKTESRRKGVFLSLQFLDISLADFIFSLILCVGRSEVGKLHGEEGVNVLVLPSRFPCLDGECNAWLKARDSGNGFTK